MLAVTPAVIAVPSLARIWVPEPKLLELPEQEIVVPLARAAASGDLMFGWITSADLVGLPLEDLQAWLINDSMYFGDGPLMLLDEAGSLASAEAQLPRISHPGYYYDPLLTTRSPAGMRRVHRFAWRGSGSPLTEGSRFTLRAGWKSRDELLTRLA